MVFRGVEMEGVGVDPPTRPPEEADVPPLRPVPERAWREALEGADARLAAGGGLLAATDRRLAGLTRALGLVIAAGCRREATGLVEERLGLDDGVGTGAASAATA